MPPNDPLCKLRAYTKRPLQHVFLNASDIRRMLEHRDGVSTIGKITVTMMNFLLQCYVFCGPYMYKYIYVNLFSKCYVGRLRKSSRLERLLLMSPRLGLRNSLGRFGTGLPPRPRNIPSRAAWHWDSRVSPVARTPAKGACFAGGCLCTGSSWRQNHAWGCYEIKHGFWYFINFKQMIERPNGSV